MTPRTTFESPRDAEYEAEAVNRSIPANLATDRQTAFRQGAQEEIGRQRRIGSTRAERLGAVPGYAPGYGWASPMNRPLGASSESAWLKAFPAAPGASRGDFGASSLVPPARMSATHMDAPTHMPPTGGGASLDTGHMAPATHMGSNALAVPPASALGANPTVSALPAPPSQLSAIPNPIVSSIQTPAGTWNSLLPNQYGTGSGLVPALGAPPTQAPNHAIDGIKRLAAVPNPPPQGT